MPKVMPKPKKSKIVKCAVCGKKCKAGIGLSIHMKAHARKGEGTTVGSTGGHFATGMAAAAEVSDHYNLAVAIKRARANLVGIVSFLEDQGSFQHMLALSLTAITNDMDEVIDYQNVANVTK